MQTLFVLLVSSFAAVTLGQEKLGNCEKDCDCPTGFACRPRVIFRRLCSLKKQCKPLSGEGGVCGGEEANPGCLINECKEGLQCTGSKSKQGVCFDPKPPKCRDSLQCGGLIGNTCDRWSQCNHKGCCENCQCRATATCDEGFVPAEDGECRLRDFKTGQCRVESLCCTQIQCKKCSPTARPRRCGRGECYNPNECRCEKSNQALCFADPCQFNSCSPGYKCEANYCGGCNYICKPTERGLCATNADCPESESCRSRVESRGEDGRAVCSKQKYCTKKGKEGSKCGGLLDECETNVCEDNLTCSFNGHQQGTCYDPRPARCFGEAECIFSDQCNYPLSKCNHRGCCENCQCRATATCPQGYRPTTRKCTEEDFRCKDYIKRSICCTEITCERETK